MNILFPIELIGTAAFAVSGACLGIRKRMDVFGIIILGMSTAVGGGIIRDLILGINPPAAFQRPVYAFLAIAVSLLVFIFRSKINALGDDNVPLLIMDSMGLAVFTVVGVRAGIESGNVFLESFLGVITGVGGGVLRDIFAGETPSIFVKHFYACASLIGALAAIMIWPFGDDIAMLAGAVVVLILRLAAARFRWDLPRA